VVDALGAAIDGLEAVDSPVLRSPMPRFFAHPEFHVIRDARTIERDRYRLQTLILPEHVGCHVDAPAHVQAERPAATIDTVAATALWGRAVCVDVSDRDWQPGQLFDLDDFIQVVADRGTTIGEGDVVLVNFGWNRHLGDDGAGTQFWSANAPGFTEALCRELRILENLEALERLAGVVYFAALPLRIEGGTGSPLRPVAFVPRG
jgi:arylformamidase